MNIIKSHFDRFKNEPATTKLWKEKALPGSGSAYDLGSHLVRRTLFAFPPVTNLLFIKIDQILSVFGKPVKVTGLVRNSRAIGNDDVEDSFVIHSAFSPWSLSLIIFPTIFDLQQCTTAPPVHPEGSFLSWPLPRRRFFPLPPLSSVSPSRVSSEFTFPSHTVSLLINRL